MDGIIEDLFYLLILAISKFSLSITFLNILTLNVKGLEKLGFLAMLCSVIAISYIGIKTIKSIYHDIMNYLDKYGVNGKKWN